MRRLFKQTTIAAIFFSLIFGFGYGVFKVTIKPSCSDRIRNQGEEGIDCGGPCPSCELKLLAPPIALRVIYLPNPARNTIDLTSQVRNPNLSWGTRGFRYQFILFDSEGNVSGRIRGQTHLLPGETRWVMAFGAFAPSRVARVEFEIEKESIEWQKLRPFSQDVRVETRNLSFRKILPPEVDFAELSGIVENNSDFTLAEITVAAVLFDQLDKILAFGQTVARDASPNSLNQFRIVWPTEFDGQVARWEVQASSNLLSDLNFVQRYGI